MNRVRENSGVQIRFLLGPAGSGKTFQCLSEVRDALLKSPEGPPLIFLAPKQATFQIERQLLGDGSLAGYTRLQILSFDRLADYVVSELGGGAQEALSEQGRVMVLRALLAREQDKLKIFRSTARLPGFAAQLSALLRELQQSRIQPERLIDASIRATNSALADKLHDVALILRRYREWLDVNKLDDAHTLLDRAAEALTRESRSPGVFGAPGVQLWLDGFAEMTPQELHLLGAFVTQCERSTLAFCLESEPPNDESASWLSLWTVVAQTFRRCKHALAAIPGAVVSVSSLPRDHRRSRFAKAPVLASVESNWSVGSGGVLVTNPGDSPSIRGIACANPQAEATFAAREILRFVRENDARFRDCAVLLRTLDGYHHIVRRVFTRFGIPFFLDRRESVTHHPLAELTRFALRTVAFGWKRDDWFGALKTGLVHRKQDAIDQLENEALKRGWDGALWRKQFTRDDGQPHHLESLRGELTPAFETFGSAVASPLTGRDLASALRALWSALDVEGTLEDWSAEARDTAEDRSGSSALALAASVHDSVLEQMQDWLGDIERAFASDAMPVSEWLPILEAGLAGLSVGVIPPALDQVLVGAVDRSRNPELRLTLLLGMNEGVFPAPPQPAAILSERERQQFAAVLDGCSLSLTTRQRLAHERYLAYIACTRSRQELVLTYSVSNSRGGALNPSPILTHLDKLMSGALSAKSGQVFSAGDWHDAEHVSEVAAAVVARAHPSLQQLVDVPALMAVNARAEQVSASAGGKMLSSEITSRIFKQPFVTSVSALEDFAACPYKFFLKHGLRLKEREEFEVDHRHKGIFQHEVLNEFHLRATASSKRWRDWSPTDAAALLREIGREKLRAYQNGLFESDAARRFTGEVLLTNLERLVSTLVTWMTHYQFDPRAVELAFGMEGSPLPGWRIALDGGRELILSGRIDRIDVCEVPGQEALGVVIDYKSSGKTIDALKLHNGLELQLLSYLGFLRQLVPGDGLPKLTPAGVFYVGLRGAAPGAPSRDDTFNDPEATRRAAFRHEGRYSGSWHSHFDTTACEEQFSSHYATKLKPELFEQLMSDVEAHLKRLGVAILDGNIRIDPYRKNQGDTACVRCDFGSVCRFDPWTERYRSLKSPPRKTETKPAVKSSRGKRKEVA